MRRRVPFCLDSVEVGDLKFYELKMVLELGFLAPERINSFPCVRNCLTPVSAIWHTVRPAAHET